MAQLFRKDRKKWSSSQVQEVQYFLKCNQFFSKFYTPEYFQQISGLAYYAKVSEQHPLHLIEHKKPAAIILLSGSIIISKRVQVNADFKKNGKRAIHQSLREQYKKVIQLTRPNETYAQSTQCKVENSEEGQSSQIIFVPYFHYAEFTKKVQEEKERAVHGILGRHFKKAENRSLLELAQSGCEIRNYKINNYLYEEGQKPEYVFLILEGSIKMERPSMMSPKNNDIVVVSVGSLVGQKDILFNYRESSAVCCSAETKVLSIGKQAFLKFWKSSLPDLKLNEQTDNYDLIVRRSRKISPVKGTTQSKLPMIMRFRSARKSTQQQKRQYNLIKNSHVLLESSKPKKSKIRSRSSFSDYPIDILEQKIKFYNKMRMGQSKIDLSNRII